MTTLSLLLGILGFVLLGLATDAHHRRWRGGTPTARGRRLLRGLAWLALALSWWLAIAARGWVFGPVLAFGLTSLAAAGVFLFLNLATPRNRRIRP